MSLNKNTMMWVLVIGIILFILDFTVFNPGLIFLLIIASAFIYYGKKRIKGFFGKLMLGMGILMLISAIINTFTFRILLLSALLFAIYQLFLAKKQTAVIEPVVNRNPGVVNEKVVRKSSLFKNIFYGRQETSSHVYEWQDINIQTGVGDCIIDLSNTVLPEGISVISVRSFVGDIKVLIPYEQEVSVHYSVLSGSLTFFNESDPRLLNKSIYMQTENFDSAERKVKIVASSFIGKIEVKRI